MILRVLFQFCPGKTGCVGKFERVHTQAHQTWFDVADYCIVGVGGREVTIAIEWPQNTAVTTHTDLRHGFCPATIHIREE